MRFQSAEVAAQRGLRLDGIAGAAQRGFDLRAQRGVGGTGLFGWPRLIGRPGLVGGPGHRTGGSGIRDAKSGIAPKPG